MHEVPVHRLSISRIEGSAAEVVRDRAVRQQVIDDDQDGGGHRAGGLRPAPASRQPPLLGRPVSALGARCRVGGLHQAGA